MSICYVQEKGIFTFSQCVHCFSKLKFPAAAFVLNLALFAIETQSLMKLLAYVDKPK